MDFLSWLENTDFSQWLASDTYANPILLCCHAVGMALVVGATWMLCLRVLGFPSGLSLGAFDSLARLSGVGFAINAVSGVLLFCSEATRLIINVDFLVKMACIVVGGIALWALGRSLAGVDRASPNPGYPVTSKAIAVGAALFWLIAIIAGRFIAYTLAPPPL